MHACQVVALQQRRQKSLHAVFGVGDGAAAAPKIGIQRRPVRFTQCGERGASIDATALPAGTQNHAPAGGGEPIVQILMRFGTWHGAILLVAVRMREQPAIISISMTQTGETGLFSWSNATGRPRRLTCKSPQLRVGWCREAAFHSR